MELQHRPEHQGFGSNIGGCNLGGPPSFFEPYKIPAIPSRRAGDYLPDRLADECISFVRTNKEKPFFLCWWDYSVHYPIQAPEKLIEKYKGRAGVQDPAYAAMIEGMDGAIGKLLTELDAMNLSGNTLVLFDYDDDSLELYNLKDDIAESKKTATAILADHDSSPLAAISRSISSR